MIGGYADCLSRVKGNLHARFLGEGGQRCSALTRQITLAWFYEDFDQQMFFDGRIQKINSWLAALTSVVFNRLMPKFDFPEDKVKQMPTFDSRVWNVPNLTEAANCFLWREKDATKNSVSMAAQAYFSYKELQNKSQSEMQEMLWSKKDINWNNYPDFFKRGTYAARRKVSRPYTTEELEMLSPKHAARTNPELLVERMAVVLLEMPPFVRVQNREEVLFQAQDFILAS